MAAFWTCGRSIGECTHPSRSADEAWVRAVLDQVLLFPFVVTP